MKIYLVDGYVSSYALIGNLRNSIEVEAPSDMAHFEANYMAYKLVDGALVFDSQKGEEILEEELKKELRRRRKTECFAIVDRSKLWYDTLTSQQYQELRAWYDAWLSVTETKVIPTKPEWL